MSNQDLINTLNSQASAPESGLGHVWRNTTHAIGETFGTVGELATATRELAMKGTEAAVYSRIEGSKELCDLLEIEAKGIDALLVSEAIVNYVTSRRRR